MKKRVRPGYDSLGVCGFVFTLTGLCFLTVGTALFFCAGGEESRLVGQIFLILGAAFLLLGTVLLYLRSVRHRHMEKLVTDGRYLWAELIELRPNFNVCYKNRNPYMAVVRYVDGNGTKHLFKSDSYLSLRPDPGLYGRQVRVYYENTDFRRYYVDVAGLTENSIEH